MIFFFFGLIPSSDQLLFLIVYQLGYDLVTFMRDNFAEEVKE